MWSVVNTKIKSLYVCKTWLYWKRDILFEIYCHGKLDLVTQKCLAFLGK